MFINVKILILSLTICLYALCCNGQNLRCISINDVATGRAISDANIIILSSSVSGVSNNSGHVYLPISEDDTILISHPGYHSLTFVVPDSLLSDCLDLRLEPSAIVLPEVVNLYIGGKPKKYAHHKKGGYLFAGAYAAVRLFQVDSFTAIRSVSVNFSKYIYSIDEKKLRVPLKVRLVIYNVSKETGQPDDLLFASPASKLKTGKSLLTFDLDDLFLPFEDVFIGTEILGHYSDGVFSEVDLATKEETSHYNISFNPFFENNVGYFMSTEKRTWERLLYAGRYANFSIGLVTVKYL